MNLPKRTALLVAVTALLALPALADAPPPGGRGGGHGQLMSFDANKDGVLTRAEVADGQKARFAEIDANKDGFATPEEFKAHADARRQAAGGEVPPKAEKGDKPRGPGKGLARMDTDNDGKVAYAEFAAPMDRIFAASDANGDGSLSKEEMKATRDKRRS